jgi:hypothetical protein
MAPPLPRCRASAQRHPRRCPRGGHRPLVQGVGVKAECLTPVRSASSSAAKRDGFLGHPRVVARHSLPRSADGDGVSLSLVKNWQRPHKTLTDGVHRIVAVERPMGRGERMTGPRGGSGQGSIPQRRCCGRTTRRKTRRCLPPDWRASALREARRRCHLWLCDCCVITGLRCRWFDSCFTRSWRWVSPSRGSPHANSRQRPLRQRSCSSRRPA